MVHVFITVLKSAQSDHSIDTKHVAARVYKGEELETMSALCSQWLVHARGQEG